MTARKKIGWVLCCAVLQAPSAWALSAAHQQTLVQAAEQAKTQCFKQMYRDTNAYAQCVRDMRQAQAGSPWKKLGVEYFGFVGALSYMRVGHMNSSQIAAEFLKDFRHTQKKLGVPDAELCSTIPGDCVVRMAQTTELESAPPAHTGMRVQCIGRICNMVPAP